MLKTCLSSGSISSTGIGFSVSSHSGYLNLSRFHSINLASRLSCIIVSLSFFREWLAIGIPLPGGSGRCFRYSLGVFHPRHYGIEKLVYQNTLFHARESLSEFNPKPHTSTQRGTHLCMRAKHGLDSCAVVLKSTASF